MHLIPLALISGIGGIVQAMFHIFAEVMTRKLAFKLAVVAALAAAFAVYALVISVAVGAVFMSLPPILQPGVYFLPGNIGMCLSALQTARIAKWVWNMKKDVMMPYGAY